MADTSPFLILGAVVGVLLLALVLSAVEAYRKDIMAKGRILMVVLMLVFVFALLAFFMVYVLGPAATAAR